MVLLPCHLQDRRVCTADTGVVAQQTGFFCMAVPPHSRPLMIQGSSPANLHKPGSMSDAHLATHANINLS
ncbi:hypothetical protein GN956_G12549 [Arapaima gigas]